MNRLKATALTVVTFCIGIALIDTAITDRAENSTGSLIFGLVIGVFCLFAGIVFFGAFCAPAWGDKKHTLKDELNELMTTDQKGAEDEDEDEVDKLLSYFRNTFRNFFSVKNIKPNSPIQNTATQLYWHMLYLQKIRMDRHKVTLDFEAERKRYAGVSVSKSIYFDGKYEITEAKERILAKRTYTAENATYVKTDSEVANYNILNARSVTDSRKIICPNCGNKASRANLLDGCDYCGTKFTVEDLGRRVSNFALRRDFEVEYDKYKDRRRLYVRKAFFFIGVPVFILSFIAMLITSGQEEDGEKMDIVMRFVASIIGAGFMGGAIGYMGTFFFMFFIFPLIQLKKSIKYTVLKKMRKNNEKNKGMILRIKQHDPLFSQEYFFSNILNKLAMIHYADKKEQISVFSEKDLSGLLKKYDDIVDMDVTDILIKRISFDENMFRIELQTNQNLVRKMTRGFFESTEKLKLTLVKHASCKTEAVCEPSVLRCRECGASISLLDGGKCEHCGSTVNLREYDWVIEDYQVV